MIGGVVLWATREGEVRSLIPIGRVPCDSCTKNVANIVGGAWVRTSLIKIYFLKFLKLILCFLEKFLTGDFINSTASKIQFQLTVFLAQPVVKIAFY